MRSILADRGNVNRTLTLFAEYMVRLLKNVFTYKTEGDIYVTWECLAHSKHPPVIYEGRHSAEPKLALAVLFNIHASAIRFVQDVDIHG